MSSVGEDLGAEVTRTAVAVRVITEADLLPADVDGVVVDGLEEDVRSD